MNYSTLARSLALFVALVFAVALHAQAPGGGAPTNARASAGQIAAVAAFNTQSAALSTAVTEARSALQAASLTLPASPAALQQAADQLAGAELALALARANWIAGLQSGGNRLTATQLAVLRSQAAGAGGGGRGGFGAGASSVQSDLAGFEPIFNGRNLDGWSGVTNWKAIDGAIVVNGGFGTTYLIYNEKKLRNFELKLEFKIVDGSNSGIQYRARLSGGQRGGRGGNFPDNPEALRALTASPYDTDPAFMATAGTIPGATGAAEPESTGGLSWQWDVGGYQFDLGGRGSGNLYEQDGRGTVVSVGTIAILEAGLTGPLVEAIGTTGGTNTGDNAGEWNSVHLIADGDALVQIMNGELKTMTFDRDPNYAATEGWLALQIEGGGQLSFRNIYLKELP